MLTTELLSEPPTGELVSDLLRRVIDPELGVNIVDLGLVRRITVEPGGVVSVVLTLTTPACPLGPYITEQIDDVLHAVVTISQVDVDVVWTPPWDPDRDMSPAAKDQLGWRSHA